MRRRRVTAAVLFLGLAGCGGSDKVEVDRLKNELAESKQRLDAATAKPAPAPTPGKTVSGTVKVGDSPLKAGKVLLVGESGLGYSGEIDATGQYTVKNVPPGKYTLSVHTFNTTPRIQLPAQFSDAFGSGFEFTVEATQDGTNFNPVLTIPK